MIERLLTNKFIFEELVKRDFKQKYKITIFEMLTRIRLSHARNMINSNPHLKLTSIAASCGFNDVSYFCKMYKRLYDCSPKSEIN